MASKSLNESQMQELNLEKRSLGVNFDGAGKAHVLVWAPKAKSVALNIKGKETAQLSPTDHGYHKLETEVLEPGDLYRFVLDGERELPDPASLWQPEGVHGASQAYDPGSFNWEKNDWQNIPLKDYIIYELHAGTFSPEGSFEGIEEKLDYLLELGITAIELMPVAQFPGARNWGYDGVFPFAVQHSYGGAAGLQRLVNACHSKGIAVILDVVYNHLGPEGNYLQEFGEYFTDKYQTPWGKAVNFDDAWCDGVRRFVIENVLMWFRDFHIDALRLDAVHAIKDFSPKHILRDIKEHVNALIEESGRQHYLIVECDLNDTRYIDPIDKGGYGMDAQWIDEFHHALRVASGNEPTGYYADFNGVPDLTKSYRDAYVYDGQYSEHRKKKFGTRATANPGQQFVVFSQNHDQIGNRMLGERTAQLVSFEMQKLLAGAVLVSPFLPMLFMGEEFGADNPFQYFISHTDEELVAAVRKGRKEEFAAFHLEGEAPDPQSGATFDRSKQQWHLPQEEPYQTMYAYYKNLIKLRKTLPALAASDRHQLDVSHHEGKATIVLHRWHEGTHVLCFMNFSKQQQSVVVSAHSQQWVKILGSSDPEWNGADAAANKLNGGDELILPPESITIYTNEHV